MLRSSPVRRRAAGALGAAGLALALTGSAQAAPHGGALYTQTNAAAGNAVQVLDRAADGSLTPGGSFATGGRGTGAGLGSQGAVALSENHRLLLAVDAGSNDVAAFRVTAHGLQLAGRASSAGTQPISVTVRKDLAYVLNAGGTPSVSALDIGPQGSLTPRAGSTQPLPAGAAAPAQVSFSPDGDELVVTEKGANRLDSFPLDQHGLPAAAVITPSSGATPFGFGFGRHGTLIVSEAGASTVSSYRPASDGSLGVVTPSALTHQGAACWIAVTDDGRFAYSANASTGSISGFAVGKDGSLSELDADGRTATSPGPNDEALAAGSRYLYALNPGAAEITAYRVAADGSLQPFDGIGGLPTRTVGLAAS